MSFLGGLRAEQSDVYARSCNPPPPPLDFLVTQGTSGTSDLKNFKADGYSILNCTCIPNFNFLGTVGGSEPLGGHIGG